MLKAQAFHLYDLRIQDTIEKVGALVALKNLEDSCVGIHK